MPAQTQRQFLTSRSSGWSDAVTFQQVDPASGDQVFGLSLTGTLVTNIGVESGEAAASLFTVADYGTVTLSRPDGSVWLTALPSTYAAISLAAFDGVVDDGGASGAIRNGIAGSDTSSVAFAPGRVGNAASIPMRGSTRTTTCPGTPTSLHRTTIR